MRDKKDSTTFELPGLAPATPIDAQPARAQGHTVPPPVKVNGGPKGEPKGKPIQHQHQLLEPTDASGLPIWRRDENTDLTGLPIWAAA